MPALGSHCLPGQGTARYSFLIFRLTPSPAARMITMQLLCTSHSRMEAIADYGPRSANPCSLVARPRLRSVQANEDSQPAEHRATHPPPHGQPCETKPIWGIREPRDQRPLCKTKPIRRPAHGEPGARRAKQSQFAPGEMSVKCRSDRRLRPKIRTMPVKKQSQSCWAEIGSGRLLATTRTGEAVHSATPARTEPRTRPRKTKPIPDRPK